MARFFMAGANVKGGTAIIRGRDAEHVRVLRLRPGEDLVICDGEGTDYKCRLVYADKEQAEAEVIEVVKCPAEPSVKVTLLCGLPKGERVDYIIQKGVEAGAFEILFFNCDRCIARPENPEKKLERWQRIAEEAAKQSGRGIIPQVGWAGEFAQALDIAVKKDLRLFMYETGEREPLNAVLDAHRDAATAAPRRNTGRSHRSAATSPAHSIRRRRSRSTAATRVIGSTTVIRFVMPRTAATESAPKATWERPSPMKEKRFSTSVTPKSEEQRAMSTPTITAYRTNGNSIYIASFANISFIASPPSRPKQTRSACRADIRPACRRIAAAPNAGYGSRKAAPP